MSSNAPSGPGMFNRASAKVGNVLTRSFGFGELSRGMAPNYGILAFSYYHLAKDAGDPRLKVLFPASILIHMFTVGILKRDWGMTPLYCMNFGFLLKKYNDSGATERLNDYILSIFLLLMFAFITEEGMKGLPPDVGPFFKFVARCGIFMSIGAGLMNIDPKKLPY